MDTATERMGVARGVFEEANFMKWHKYNSLAFYDFWKEIVDDTLEDDISEIDTFALLCGLGCLLFGWEQVLSLVFIVNWFNMVFLKLGGAPRVGPVISMMLRSYSLSYGFYAVTIYLRSSSAESPIKPAEAAMCVLCTIAFLYHVMHTVSCVYRSASEYTEVPAWRMHMLNIAFKFLEIYTLLPLMVMGTVRFFFLHNTELQQNNLVVLLFYGLSRIGYIWLSTATSHRALSLQVFVNVACLAYIVGLLYLGSSGLAMYQFLLVVVVNLVQDVLFYMGSKTTQTYALVCYGNRRDAYVFRAEPDYFLLSNKCSDHVYCLRVIKRDVCIERMDLFSAGEQYTEPPPAYDRNKVSVGHNEKVYGAMVPGIVGVYETYEDAKTASEFYLSSVNGANYVFTEEEGDEPKDMLYPEQPEME